MVSYILTESDKCFFGAMESREENLQLQILQEQYSVFRAEDSLRVQVVDARDSQAMCISIQFITDK